MKSDISALDVANYIIDLSQKTGEPVTNMKLQKLLFYSYAWYMVETGKKLFDDEVVAWKYGPVIVAAYHAYEQYGADTIKEADDGDPDKLNSLAKEIIEDVFNVYGGMGGIDLANLSHTEQPWLQTFEEGKNNIIPDDLILEYYTAKKERAESAHEQS